MTLKQHNCGPIFDNIDFCKAFLFLLNFKTITCPHHFFF